MAETPIGILTFEGTCPDCGRREASLPTLLPDVGDDFDWRLRDYDSLRLSMMEELSARFPERRRWTPGDLEVVLVEVVAALLDQLSDLTDRVAAEMTLQTARRPESVRRLLTMIGYDALGQAWTRKEISVDPDESEKARQLATQELESLWLRNPFLLEAARQAGPRAIHTQHRMVTIEDYVNRLEDHPLVLRVNARQLWTGSWNTIRATVVAWDNHQLDDKPDASADGSVSDYSDDIKGLVDDFHKDRGLEIPVWDTDPTIRTVLRPYIEAYRMAGQEVSLQDAIVVPITFSVSILVAPNYFRSEILRAVDQTLGLDPGGFFEHGRLQFGEDLHVSDLIESLMANPGIEHVCVNRFKRLGRQFPDQAESGRIILEDLEIAVCDNKPDEPARGYWRATLHGGRHG